MHDGSWNFISSDTLLKRTKNRVGQWWWCNVYWKTFRRFHFQPLAALSFPGSAFASGLKCRKKWSMWKIRFFPIQVYLFKRFFFQVTVSHQIISTESFHLGANLKCTTEGVAKKTPNLTIFHRLLWVQSDERLAFDQPTKKNPLSFFHQPEEESWKIEPLSILNFR